MISKEIRLNLAESLQPRTFLALFLVKDQKPVS